MNNLVFAKRGADGDYPPSPGMNVHPDFRLPRIQFVRLITQLSHPMTEEELDQISNRDGTINISFAAFKMSKTHNYGPWGWRKKVRTSYIISAEEFYKQNE